MERTPPPIRQSSGGRRLSRAGLRAVLAAIMLAVAGVIWWALTACFTPHCVPVDRLAAIRTGMTKQQVVALLGSPQTDKQTGPNHRELWYWKHWRFCSVCVPLDGADRVQSFTPSNEPSIFHDH